MDKLPKLKEGTVEIPMSTAFYERVVAAALFFLENNVDNTEDSEAKKKVIDNLKSQNFTEEWLFHYETLAIIMGAFNKAAKEKGLVKL